MCPADIRRAQVPAAATGRERAGSVHPTHGRRYLLPAHLPGVRGAAQVPARAHDVGSQHRICGVDGAHGAAEGVLLFVSRTVDAACNLFAHTLCNVAVQLAFLHSDRLAITADGSNAGGERFADKVHEVLASKVYTMCFAVQALLYLMGIPSAVPFLEVVSYAGYPFVHVCIAAIFGAAFGETCTTCLLQSAYTSCFCLSCSMWLRRRLSCFDVRTQRIVVNAWRCGRTLQGMSAGSYCPEQQTNLAVLADATGRVAWYVLWGYGALCMAIFTVRTIKRVIFHEARQYSELPHMLSIRWIIPLLL